MLIQNIKYNFELTKKKLTKPVMWLSLRNCLNAFKNSFLVDPSVVEPSLLLKKIVSKLSCKDSSSAKQTRKIR